ncbi:PPK2 family polyphosphate kinase [Actinacidiphila bryophytorum]|uniref:Polyphosphate:AMP/ADP phosphotransferase n=1 Tax=Actinacidiphila bryophytorum TaxID=1436133 RepID=A0A9W4MK70_9ACTN|nr:PPK2 family polyphosphate kinase [Actinacidiphila bryophytorum]MBM9436696.1 polyphosphate kinase 2 family protein [Actinacidiphila bryophytorum]MBN6545557.1 polyphosphate kinase 2 family protein [Actinacidiphila bryophytorum]CAG7654027.1 Polyphosphate:AMP/ADP phosphotransferase [Actinacidiphila bryophytorum]
MAKDKRKKADGSLRSLLRVPQGVSLAEYDTRATPGSPGGKAKALAETELVRARLADLQERLFAQSTAGDPRCVLLVLQGMDTSGKGGTVKHVAAGLNPTGVRVTAFKAPTAEESQHPFLWRIRRALPVPGEIGVFDRSHYEDVLIARVRKLVPRSTWSRRYGVINRFEQSLADDGVTVVKVFLHIGYEEQRERLVARLDNPAKHWKFNEGDIAERALWPSYQQAYEAALERCSTDSAPWYLVPADRKWYRNWAVAQLLLEHLELIGPEYPPAGFDVAASRAALLET